jgi:hypothetical protein
MRHIDYPEGVKMEAAKVHNWLPQLAGLLSICAALVGFIGGTYFKGYVDASAITSLAERHDEDRGIVMESIRQRYNQTDKSIDAIKIEFNMSQAKAQNDRDELKNQMTQALVAIGEIQGARSVP